MKEYYRLQNSSSEIFTTSLVALGRIGDSSDKMKLYDYILKGEGEERVIAMEAVAATQLIEGWGALPGGVQTLAEVATKDESPKFRAAALYALRPFAYHQDKTAITALLSGVGDPSPKVRIEAVWALGVGDVEDQPRVRRVLRVVAKTDPSPFVRRAANLSLSGAKKVGRFLRSPFW